MTTGTERESKSSRNTLLNPQETGARFADTHWSLIFAAQATASPQAEAALARLCETYWYPVYAFLRRRGSSPHDAQDLTQGFFAHILRRDWLKNVGPEKGRFRTFVLKCLTNFVLNQPREPVTLPLQVTDAETRYSAEPVDHITPEQLFEMRWAVTILEQAHQRLRSEEAEAGRAQRFEALAPFVSKETAPSSFADLAQSLGISPEAARQEVSRLRKRYREAIRSEIAETVASRQDAEAELRYLFTVLSR